jgi:ribosomal protein S27E
MVYTTTVAAPPPTSDRPILDRCPGCGGEHLYTVFDGASTNFLCRLCSRCWSVDRGRMHRVDPITCPGCEWRGVCTSRWDCPAPQATKG